MMPGTYCPTTPSRAYSQRCTCAAPWRRARIDPRRRTCATPCCQAPRRSQYRARSASPPLSTAPELPEAWKQKSDQNCNFFAIGNCRRCPNHGSSPENEANDRSVPHFHFTGDEKEPLIAKMLQKRQDFCFRKANCRNRSGFRNEPIAKRGGKSRDELIAATRQTPMNDVHT